MTPCMGGWCSLRDHCRHFHVGTMYRTPSERLCRTGQDGRSDVYGVEPPAPTVRQALLVPISQANPLTVDDLAGDDE